MRNPRHVAAFGLVFLATTVAVVMGARGGDPPARPPVLSQKAYSKPADAQLRKSLTSAQYDVTQKGMTERPFMNAFWNNHQPGLYVDVATGEPLFSSTDKFDSGT